MFWFLNLNFRTLPSKSCNAQMTLNEDSFRLPDLHICSELEVWRHSTPLNPEKLATSVLQLHLEVSETQSTKIVEGNSEILKLQIGSKTLRDYNTNIGYLKKESSLLTNHRVMFARYLYIESICNVLYIQSQIDPLYLLQYIFTRAHLNYPIKLITIRTDQWLAANYFGLVARSPRRDLRQQFDNSVAVD